MTIKQRLFYSNIRMILITVIGIITVFLITRIIVVHILSGAWNFRKFSDYDSFMFVGSADFVLLVAFTVFVVFICIINSMLTFRMTKRITRPLDTLTSGVKQIHENNFSYRIAYNDNDDEFKLVCKSFNSMAAQLEASAIQRSKDEANRRELLAGISHDLRTPLTTINGYLDGLESGVASTIEMREKYFSIIKKNSRGMEHIIDQLFLFSKLDMDEYHFYMKRFDIVSAISDMVDEVTEKFEMEGLVINLTECADKIYIYGDVIYLRRVLINILENSAKYKDKDTGHIEINLSIENNYVCIKLADDGPGVSPEALSSLFNAYYRCEPSRHTTGSGLGLAICAKIIERLGGTIIAENGEKSGLVIIINLPIDTGNFVVSTGEK